MDSLINTELKQRIKQHLINPSYKDGGHASRNSLIKETFCIFLIFYMVPETLLLIILYSDKVLNWLIFFLSSIGSTETVVSMAEKSSSKIVCHSEAIGLELFRFTCSVISPTPPCLEYRTLLLKGYSVLPVYTIYSLIAESLFFLDFNEKLKIIGLISFKKKFFECFLTEL